MRRLKPHIKCYGRECPLKYECKRYYPGLDKMKTKIVHFAYPPFKDNEGYISCSYLDKEIDGKEEKN